MEAKTNSVDKSNRLTKFVMRAASGTILIQMFYLASGFATTIILSKWLGANGLGTYNFAMSWLILSIIVSKFGFEEFLVRETSSLEANKDYETAKKLWRFSIRFVLFAATSVILLIGASLWILNFENPHLEPSFWIGLLIIPLLSLTGLFRSRLRAYKRIVSSQLPEGIVRPGLLLGLSGVLFFAGATGTPEIAMGLNLFATIAAFGSCFFLKHRKENTQCTDSIKSPDEPKGGASVKQNLSTNQWILGAMPFVLIAGIHIVNQRADRLMLGGMIDMDAVGFYSIAAQMAMVVNFTLLGVNQAVAPLIAERHESKKSAELEPALMKATLIATLVSILILFALFYFGRWVLRFFKPEFQACYIPMLILAAGQLVNVSAGPAGAILSMSKKERIVGVGIGISAIVNLILNAVLIPFWGIIGASIATAVSMATWNILMVVFTKRTLGLNANAWAYLVPSRTT